MKVSDQIEVFKKVIEQLEKLDPSMEMVGHIAMPSDGYSGDVDGNIDRLEVDVDPMLGGAIIEVHY